MKASGTQIQKGQQVVQMERFRQLLAELYGQNVTMQIRPFPSLFVKEQSVTERETVLLRWMFEYLQQQPEAGLDSTVSIQDLLLMVWQMAQQTIEANEKPTSPEFELLPSVQEAVAQLPFPLLLLYLSVGGKNQSQNQNQLDKVSLPVHTQHMEQPEWFEMIRELASSYNKRCVLTCLSDTQAGVLVPLTNAEPSAQALDDIFEECISWVDALLAEVFVDAKIGISRPVMSDEQLAQGMMEAIFACKIGNLNGSKHGVFVYERLGMQRILYNLHEGDRSHYRESMLSQDSYQALGQELRETALAFFRNHLNISETARMLYMHRNSLLYRLDKIREQTGYDIRKFEDAAAFWTALMLWKIDEKNG